jgi:hypothetical protein
MKEFLTILKLKPSHFIDGWASFDALSYQELIPLIKISRNLLWGDFRIINILINFSELMCFGKVNMDGDIKIEGVCGFPSGDTCLKYLRDVSDLAKKKKITDSYVYVEW